jgi:hypothetical protein
VIGEWSAALDHLTLLARIGESVPLGARHAVQAELRWACSRWATLTNHYSYSYPEDRARVLSEARAWATDHASEIEAVTTERKIHDTSTGR